jgi:predicted kinase
VIQYAKPEERTAIEAVAWELDLPFTGLWLEASEEVLCSRVTKRRSLNSAWIDCQSLWQLCALVTAGVV